MQEQGSIHQEELSEQAGDELYEHHRIVADKGQNPLRIDKFLGNRLENASRNKIQNAAKAGNIHVNGRSVKQNYKVRPGDTVSIVLSWPPRETDIKPENIPLDMVYQDEHLVVINKQAGLVVHPGIGNHSGTLVNALAHHLEGAELFQKGEVRPGLVHRIDKDTTGLMVVAKTELAQSHLARQFFEHSTERKYQAIVWGLPKEKEATIEGHIGREAKDRLRMGVFPDGSQGKHAITHYKVLEEIGYISLVECVLETGRTHQIRTHMRHIGHPLFNDARYGGDQILKGASFTKYKQFVQNCFKVLPRQALHAQILGFTHPATGKRMHFESPLPQDMTELLEKWRRYISGRQDQ